MPFTHPCPFCAAAVLVTESDVGRPVRCATCDANFTLPAHARERARPPAPPPAPEGRSLLARLLVFAGVLAGLALGAAGLLVGLLLVAGAFDAGTNDRAEASQPAAAEPVDPPKKDDAAPRKDAPAQPVPPPTTNPPVASPPVTEQPAPSVPPPPKPDPDPVVPPAPKPDPPARQPRPGPKFEPVPPIDPLPRPMPRPRPVPQPVPVPMPGLMPQPVIRPVPGPVIEPRPVVLPGPGAAPLMEPRPGPLPRPGLVRPPARPVPITPTKAADRAVVLLPGAADAACYAGGGRFVLLRLAERRELAVFDVSEGKVVKQLPLLEPGCLIAGGMNHFYVVAPAANQIERWSLASFEKEAAVANPVPGRPKQVVVGHATDGPLFVLSTAAFQVIDGQTFWPVRIPVQGGRGGPEVWGDRVPQVRISADGRVIAWWEPTADPSGLNSLEIGAGETRAHWKPVTVGAILPGPDGTLFTGGGLYTPGLEPVGRRLAWQPADPGPIPAARGGFYLEFQAEGTALKALGEDRPLAKLGVPDAPDLLPAGLDDRRIDRQRFPVYDRVFFVPDAKAVVVLNGSGDRLTVHRLDPEELLQKTAVPYLFVEGRPVAAERGAVLTYAPAVRSKAGGVKLKLEAGPDGMRVMNDRVIWAVPRNFAADEVTVVLSVTDAGRQEVVHTFTLPVVGGPRVGRPDR
jgi:hypothetical protein